MKHIRRACGIIAAANALALLVLAPPAVSTSGDRATDPSIAAPRILLMGDSITKGFNGDYTWRYRLAKEFTRQQTPVDFVGSMSGLYVAPGYTSSHYADPNFDSNFYARVGDQLLWMKDLVGREVTWGDPDIVVLEGGLNDMLNGTSAEETRDRLATWIVNARAAKPGIRIVLSPVLPVDRPDLPTLNGTTARFNQLEADLAAETSTDASPVTVADTTAGWLPADPRFTVDGIHPAPAGETLIAQRIADHLHMLGVLPQQPQIFNDTLRWSRTLTPRVVRSATRLTITWDAQALSGATLYVHRPGLSLYRYYRGGSLMAGAARHTTYTFRLRLNRAREWGPWGPIVTVKVP